MALTVTSRTLSNRGRWKYEVGKYTGAGSGDSVETKVGQLLWVRVRGIDQSTVDEIISINSKTSSDTQDDHGFFFVGAAAAGDYGYEAIGRG